MKKVFKSRIFLVLVTAIICLTVGVHAGVTYEASQIIYKNTTLDHAIDDLYAETNRSISFGLENSRWNNAAGFRLGDLKYKYKYIKITAVNCSNNETGYANFTSLDWTSENLVSLNQQYLTNSFSSIRVYANNKNSTAQCIASIILYN